MTPNPFVLHSVDDPEGDDNGATTPPLKGHRVPDSMESPSVQLLRELQEGYREGEGGVSDRSVRRSEEGAEDGEVFHSTFGLAVDRHSKLQPVHEGMGRDDSANQDVNLFHPNPTSPPPHMTSTLDASFSSPFEDRTLSSNSTSQVPTPTLSSHSNVRGRPPFPPSPPSQAPPAASSSQIGFGHKSYRSDSASPPPDLFVSRAEAGSSSSVNLSTGQSRTRTQSGPVPIFSPGNSELEDGRSELEDALLEDGFARSNGMPSGNGHSGGGAYEGGTGKDFFRSEAAGIIHGNLDGKRSSETIRAGTPPVSGSRKNGKGPSPVNGKRRELSAVDPLNESLARPPRSRPSRDDIQNLPSDLDVSGPSRPGARPSTSRSTSSRQDRTRTTKPVFRGGDHEVDSDLDLNFRKAARGLGGRERAMWGWVNVIDLDGFLQEVYEYYVGKGIYCIIVRKVLNLLTSGFVIIFSTFLLSCVDYTRFPSDGNGMLKDVIVEHCASRWSTPHIILTWVFGIFFVWKLASFALSVPRLAELKRFYEFLLNVPNEDIQTVSWPEVVRRIGEIKQDNPTTSLRNTDNATDDFLPEGEMVKLDAHDIANRIMRQENYLIALFNKDLLDLRLTLPIPAMLAPLIPSAKVQLDNNGSEETAMMILEGTGLTQALEWNLRYCLLQELFDERGLVKKDYIRGRNRKLLVARLQRRFIFMGILNAIFAPYIVLYLLMYSFFRYFEEYHKNPSSIGSRKYTQYARWRFREFNELPHLFDRRLDESYVMAKQYIDQFPKELTALTMRFVAFVAGAFAAVLGLLSVIDPVFLHFEITPNRTVLFYLGFFTSVLAVSRGMVPPANLIFDPELLMTEVVWHTHYMPDEWQGQLHSKAVHAQFGELFRIKLATFASELLSVLVTPFILWFSLPRCSGNIVDFFREFTIHVDGLGYVCSFAVFDFKRKGAVKVDEEQPSKRSTTIALPTPDGGTAGMEQARTKAAARRHTHGPKTDGAKQNVEGGSVNMLGRESKMEKSFLHFKVTHPDWLPSDPSSSMLLSRLADDSPAASHSAIGSVTSQALSPVRATAISSYPNGSIGARSRSTEAGMDLDRERRLRDKSALYEKALQRSIMLHGSGTIGGVGPGLAKSKLGSRIGHFPGADRLVNSRPADSVGTQHGIPHRMHMTTTMNHVAEEDERLQPEDVALNDLASGEVDDGWLTRGGGGDQNAERLERGVGRLRSGRGDEEKGYGQDGQNKDDGNVIGLLRHVMK